MKKKHDYSVALCVACCRHGLRLCCVQQEQKRANCAINKFILLPHNLLSEKSSSQYSWMQYNARVAALLSSFFGRTVFFQEEKNVETE